MYKPVAFYVSAEDAEQLADLLKVLKAWADGDGDVDQVADAAARLHDDNDNPRDIFAERQGVISATLVEDVASSYEDMVEDALDLEPEASPSSNTLVAHPKWSELPEGLKDAIMIEAEVAAENQTDPNDAVWDGINKYHEGRK